MQAQLLQNGGMLLQVGEFQAAKEHLQQSAL
jgi:hypothetical protein